jgi:hypothetical protein
VCIERTVSLLCCLLEKKSKCFFGGDPGTSLYAVSLFVFLTVPDPKYS